MLSFKGRGTENYQKENISITQCDLRLASITVVQSAAMEPTIINFQGILRETEMYRSNKYRRDVSHNRRSEFRGGLRLCKTKGV